MNSIITIFLVIWTIKFFVMLSNGYPHGITLTHHEDLCMWQSHLNFNFQKHIFSGLEGTLKCIRSNSS